MITLQTRFPIPIHEGSSAIWHLTDILDWMQVQGDYVLEQTVVDVAKIAKQVNLSKELRFLVTRINQNVRDHV